MKSRSRKCDTVRSSEVVFQEDFPNDVPDFNREALAEARMGARTCFWLLRSSSHVASSCWGITIALLCREASAHFLMNFF